MAIGLARPGGPSAAELFALGVARVSIGERAMCATLGLVRLIARELHDNGSSEALARYSFSFAEADALFAP